jgi:ATP synthase F1 delta subunit
MNEHIYDIGALLRFLEENAELRWFITDLFNFEEILAERGEVADYLGQQYVPAERKLEYLEQVVQPFVKEGFYGFLALLVRNGDFTSYSQLKKEILVQLERDGNFLFSQVVSAVRLEPEQMRRIRKHLESLCGRQVFLYNHISPRTVLAGFMIRYNEKMIDFSALASLQRAKIRLLDQD